MTDDQIVATIQRAVDDLAAAMAAEVNRALHSLAEQVSAALTEDRQSISTVAAALGERTTITPPPLGEIVVRLEPGPSTKRVERDKAGNITRVVEEPADG